MSPVGCLMLFALPFAAAGVGMGGCAARTAIKHRSAQSWLEVPAAIKTASLKQNSGEDGSTYQAMATYEYDFGGRRYTGDRVSLYHGSDNMGRFQRDAFNTLDGHLRTGRPFRCFVNPRYPQESVLYRNVRWEMMLLYCGMAALFGSVGAGLFTGSFVAWCRQRADLANESPSDHPWLSRSDWAAGRIGPSDSLQAAVPVTAAVAIWWNLASLPLVMTLPSIVRASDTRWAWTTFALPGVGALVMLAAVYQALRKRKFGESVFEMAQVPGVVGGPLSGVVRIPKLLQPANGFRLRLLCMITTRDEQGESEHEKVLWQDEQFVDRSRGHVGSRETRLPVLLAIPYDARPTSPPHEEARIRWLLEVSAKLPGVDYKSEFEVPVFKTPESRQDFKIDERLVAESSSPKSNNLILREAGIVKEAVPNGVRLVFPAARNPGSALLVSVVATALCGGAWLMYQNELLILFPIVFGLVGLLFAWLALDLWLYRSVVEASRRGLRMRAGLLGIGRVHVLAAEEITRFSSRESMSSGKNVWCTIHVVGNKGSKCTIGKGISSKLAERAVIDELNAALRRAS